MHRLLHHGRRIALGLLPLLLALAHATGWMPIEALYRTDNLIHDTRLRATMPRTHDDRVVIVDLDEKSLAEVGRWPWSRDHMARLVDQLFERHKVAVLGFDVVFAEPDDSSGLPRLQALARRELADNEAYLSALERLRPTLDHDGRFAKALQGRPVVLGYYFTSDRGGLTSGTLPAPVMRPADLGGRPVRFTQWNGHGANLPRLAEAAPRAGFFNAITDSDGVVRAVPLLAEHQGAYYESLSLAMFRLLLDSPRVEPGFPQGRFLSRHYGMLESVRLVGEGGQVFKIPVDDRVAALVPFRGPGGPQGGSFSYVSATDVLHGRVDPQQLAGRIVLLGTTAPGLLDLRVTPVGETYPGVETHANLIASLLDGDLLVRPDYAMGYELVMLLLVGLLLAVALPMLPATRAVALSALVLVLSVALNLWVYQSWRLVLPLASILVLIALIFALNMSYGYLTESRAKRHLAQLFGTYVPPELVDEMVKDPDRYSMAAESRELTVMFCDMRGFTALSETLAPAAIQALLNRLFSRLTRSIRQRKGTIDKYMGDCVMAFWGAPVRTRMHAELAVAAALDMIEDVAAINREQASRGQRGIGVGIGLSTGDMHVGDMGSDVRRSYTVIGDAVNLGSRLEALCRVYGMDIIASQATREQAPGFVWQEVDRVRVKGRDRPETIHTPLAVTGGADRDTPQELKLWTQFLKAWHQQDWDGCDVLLVNLQRLRPGKRLYTLYSERVAQWRLTPPPSGWDGTTTFDSK